MDFYAPLNVDNFNIEFIGYVRLLLAQHVSLLLICENSPSYKLYENAISFLPGLPFSWDMYIRFTIQMICHAFTVVLVTQKEGPAKVSLCSGWSK